jgi:hypothetical protein
MNWFPNYTWPLAAISAVAGIRSVGKIYPLLEQGIEAVRGSAMKIWKKVSPILAGGAAGALALPYCQPMTAILTTVGVGVAHAYFLQEDAPAQTAPRLPFLTPVPVVPSAPMVQLAAPAIAEPDIVDDETEPFDVQFFGMAPQKYRFDSVRDAFTWAQTQFAAQRGRSWDVHGYRMSFPNYVMYCIFHGKFNPNTEHGRALLRSPMTNIGMWGEEPWNGVDLSGIAQIARGKRLEEIQQAAQRAAPQAVPVPPAPQYYPGGWPQGPYQYPAGPYAQPYYGAGPYQYQ